MKKILSLALVLMILLGVLSSCNVAETDESTETATETATEIATETATETTTDTTTDTTDNTETEEGTKISINSLEKTATKTISVFDELYLGAYLGDEIPSSKGCSDHELGDYYKLIKSYEELCALVECPEKVSSDFFEENYILAIGSHYMPSIPTTSYAYANLRYSPHANQLQITSYVEYDQYIEVITACAHSNTYLAVSKKDFFLREYFDSLETGPIIINEENIKYYALAETELISSRQITELELGSCFLFDFYSYDDGKDMFEKYDVRLNDEQWPYNCESDFQHLAIYARHCSHHIDYENVHITNGKIYLMLNTLEHTEECQNIEPTIKLIAVSETRLNYEQINSETEIVILVTEIKVL